MTYQECIRRRDEIYLAGAHRSGDMNNPQYTKQEKWALDKINLAIDFYQETI